MIRASAQRFAMLSAAIVFELAWQPSAFAPQSALSLPAPIAQASGMSGTLTSARRPIASPAGLSIPRIHLQASIVPVGVEPDGKLGVPSDPAETGWFSFSAPPGAEGTAIIDGHRDTTAGPGAFWNLHRLSPGDGITVTDAAGQPHAFTVTAVKLYGVEGAPLEEIFGDALPGRHLHLITCAGTWSKRLGHYDKRLVVFAEEGLGQR